MGGGAKRKTENPNRKKENENKYNRPTLPNPEQTMRYKHPQTLFVTPRTPTPQRSPQDQTTRKRDIPDSKQRQRPKHVGRTGRRAIFHPRKSADQDRAATRGFLLFLGKNAESFLATKSRIGLAWTNWK